MSAITASPKALKKGMITVSVMLATIMQVLDTTIANVSLPHMQGSLSATQDQITWVLTSYIVASAIMTLPTGWLSGRVGRKKVFQISIFGFTVASVLCGLSSSLSEMIFFRLLQGAFGAALIPISQSVLLDINPKEKHGSAMALWGIGIMIGPILGPTLGDYLTEYYDWRWVFYINLPVGIASMLGVSIFLHETTPNDRPFDAFGFLTLSFGLGAIQLILDRGEQLNWLESTEILIYFGVVFGMIWIFIWHSHFTKNPFLSPELFVDRNFITSLIFIFFIGIILLATMALLPPYMQNLMGYPVLDVGLLMAPRGAGTMISMVIVGKISGKIDPRIPIFSGMCLVAYSLFEMSTYTSFVPEHLIVRGGIIQGLGLGFIFVPLSTIAFSTLDSKYRVEAAGLFSLMRNLGSSIGVSIVVTMLSHNLQMNHSYLSESITHQSLSFIKKIVPQIISSDAYLTAMMDVEINKQAATISYINDFSMMMWIVILTMPLVLLLKNPLKAK